MTYLCTYPASISRLSINQSYLIVFNIQKKENYNCMSEYGFNFPISIGLIEEIICLLQYFMEKLFLNIYLPSYLCFTSFIAKLKMIYIKIYCNIWSKMNRIAIYSVCSNVSQCRYWRIIVKHLVYHDSLIKTTPRLVGYTNLKVHDLLYNEVPMKIINSVCLSNL